MAATEYQVLYRYINKNSNTLVTNETEEKYNAVFDLYHDQHKIEIGTADQIIEADAEKQNQIIEGNLSTNPNYNMLFKYTGTKRKSKKVWVPAKIGYVIRDWQAIQHLISPAGDYSGDYVMIGGTSPETSTVVSKTNPVEFTIPVVSDSSGAANGTFYEEAELYDLITSKTIAKLNTSSTSQHGTPSRTKTYPITYNTNGTAYIGPVLVDVTLGTIQAYRDVVIGNTTNTGLYASMQITPAQVQTMEIPAHFEEVPASPYAIADTYERIGGSPWFVMSRHASIESALEKARSAVQAIGIENVRLIKIVPTDQFIKIP